jgi:hypothetical protein
MVKKVFLSLVIIIGLSYGLLLVNFGVNKYRLGFCEWFVI